MAIFRGDGGAGDANTDITINSVTQKASEAAASATAAASSATSAATSASNASTSESNASTSATAAASSASSAATSATNASTSASTASTQASNASTSATAASTAQTAAEAAQTAAEAAETNAGTSATNAAASATTATTKASEASTSATNAATSATTATTKASEASTSASNAATSATNAATSETNAASSASAAATSASNAATSETNAAASATAAAAELSTAALKANNLSDLASASTARTNLGLGTAATTASTDYATAAQGTTADSALQNIVEDTTPQLGGNLDTQSFTVDGRDVSTDGTKLDTIETNADVTDTANVTAAGALMDSEVTNLAQVKAFNSADYATAAQGTTADSALQNVVEDTTPQLGGDLDTNSNYIYTANGGIVTRPNAKPIMINGDMNIAQRGTSTAGVTTSGYYTVDRINTAIGTAGTFTQSQVTDAPTGSGFATSLKMDCTTANASLSAGSFLTIQHRLEGQDLQLLKKGTASAEYVTISFWVKSAKTGTYTVEIEDRDNTRHISQSYTISSANTWEKKVLSFAGDTTGTLGNDNLESLRLLFWLVAGSTYSGGTLDTSWATMTQANRAVGNVNLADSTSNDWYLTGVQLEVGEYTSTTLPPFQHESHADSLLRCQRYYEKTNPATETPGQTDGAISANWGILNAADSSTLVTSMIQWKVDKRVSPTMTFYATDGTSGNLNVNGTNRAVTANFVGETNLGRISVASGGAAGNYVAFMFEATAEL